MLKLNWPEAIKVNNGNVNFIYCVRKLINSSTRLKNQHWNYIKKGIQQLFSAYFAWWRALIEKSFVETDLFFAESLSFFFL